MTRLVTLFAAIALFSVSLFGQGAAVNFSPVAPSGTCTVGAWFDTALGNLWVCNSGTWQKGPSSVDGLTITASTGTLTIANGKTATVSNTITLAGTDATTMTFPTTSATIARTDAANTFTGVQTMTAPALTNPVIVGPAPVACGATCSPTVGQLSLLNQGAGSTATLPTSSGSGNVIRFRISVVTTSAQEKILLATVTDVIIGTAIGENAGTAKVFVGNAGTYHSIQMPFAGSQPSGGFVGDQITCTDIAAGTWACDINYQSGTTPTTPYSTATT